jgi:hypothetical protein
MIAILIPLYDGLSFSTVQMMRKMRGNRYA